MNPAGGLALGRLEIPRPFPAWTCTALQQNQNRLFDPQRNHGQ
jgi:hypothetical protein